MAAELKVSLTEQNTRDDEIFRTFKNFQPTSLAVEKFKDDTCAVMKPVMDKCLQRAYEVSENHGLHNRLLNHYTFCLQFLASTIEFVQKWSPNILDKTSFRKFCTVLLRDVKNVARHAMKTYEEMPDEGPYDEDNEPKITFIPLFATAEVRKVLKDQGFSYNEIRKERLSESNSTVTVSDIVDFNESISEEKLHPPKEQLFQAIIDRSPTARFVICMQTPPSSPLPTRLIYSPNIDLDASCLGSPPPPLASIRARQPAKSNLNLPTLSEPENEKSPEPKENPTKADVVFVERTSLPKLDFSHYTDEELRDDKSEC